VNQISDIDHYFKRFARLKFKSLKRFPIRHADNDGFMTVVFTGNFTLTFAVTGVMPCPGVIDAKILQMLEK